MGTVLCIFSLKGGVGKTITAVNLAAALAVSGKKTLLVDCDPQGGATNIAGVSKEKYEKNLKTGILGEASIDEIMAQGCLEFMKVIPAPHGFFQPEMYSISRPGEAILKDLLALPKKTFDYIILDTPSSLGFITINALNAANAVLIPIQCEYLSLTSLQQTLQVLVKIKKTYNHKLKLAGILLTMCDIGENISEKIVRSIRKKLGFRLFKTIIPREAQLRDSTSKGKPLVALELESVGAKSYLELAGELMERMPRRSDN